MSVVSFQVLWNDPKPSVSILRNKVEELERKVLGEGVVVSQGDELQD